MNNNTKGWAVLLAAIGMLLTSLATEIKDLESWVYISTPGFVASVMIHVGSVIGAFVSGKLMERGDL